MSASSTHTTLANKAISLRLDSTSNKIVVRSLWSGETLQIGYPFQIYLGAESILPSGGMHKVAMSGKGLAPITESLDLPERHLKVLWSLDLTNGRHYARETLSLTATGGSANVTRIFMGNGSAVHPRVGKVQGSPVMTDGFFVGLEHPMSAATAAADGTWSTSIDRKIPIAEGQTITYTAVIGAVSPGQLRRSFLSYLEQQRPRPYEPFLHYNSWYDLGEFGRYTADQCVERINTFGRELVQKRQVKLRSFLFDDGWDDPETVWKFHQGFPNGFAPLKSAAEAFGADPGVWLSPWGGYGGPRDQRLSAGKAAGMEIDSQGYALSGPKYFDLFHKVCLDFVNNFGVNQFKFDGTGSPDKKYPGSRFASDFEAAISLISDLRAARPGLFINLTTGTWPSPFWTRYADSIWRGGEDHSFAGVGPWREKWITYRDGDTFHNVVSAGTLFPLNSLMLHGLIYAHYAQHLNDDPGDDFRNDIRSYFGNGTQLQEMYVTPSLLTTKNWDDLAGAAKWSFANRDVLVDTHWVGGDPIALSVYGWASWSPRKAILTLRNPSDKPQAFSIDPGRVFELPGSSRGTWTASSAYPDDPAKLEVPVGQSRVVVLKPFQVLVLEGPIR